MKKKIFIIIASILILVMWVWLSVSYLVNTWKTKAKSNADTDYYNKIEELNSIEKDTKNTSFNFNIITNLFINTTFANSNDSNLTPLKFSPKINKLLEKYYILSKLDLNIVPSDIFEYARLNFDELPYILNSYDYLNKTNTLDNLIKIKKEYKNKTFYKETIRKDLNDIVNWYFSNKKIKNNLTYFPKDIIDDKGYQFMIDWLKNHKFLVNKSKEIWKKLGFDYRLTLAAILTEQFRYNWTYRWIVKSYMKNTPFIFSMTKWSYWIWGIKEFTGKKIEEDAKIYGYYDKIFNAKKSDIYKDYNIKDFLQNKYFESIYPNVLIANIITRWERAGYSIKNKPWIILTLYNFWNSSIKKPHAKPQIWGAIITLKNNKNRKYTFWWLWEALYYYIKLYWLYK